MKFSDLPTQPWREWQKILFRFFFIFYFVFEGPWFVFSVIPKASSVLGYYDQAVNSLALFCNRIFFHIPPATKPPNGNGDYPEQWMMVCTSLLVAVFGCLIWSIVDRKRTDYRKLNYWFCLGIRFFLITNGISYGLIKMLKLQMPFPNLSQLATPLGDYLPMRFSWMFIGYSSTYQFFSGAIEVLAALLLLFRKTATLGALVATGVFLNVMMLNLSYDIPVKINSISLVILSLYLLAQEIPRLYYFFFDQMAIPSSVFISPFETKRGRAISIVAKWAFVALLLYTNIDNGVGRLNFLSHRKMPAPVKAGVYDIITQIKSGDTITATMPDSLTWQNIVFDRGYEGSIKTNDSRLRQRYGRSYFSFEIDSAVNLISIKRSATDSEILARFTYSFQDSVLMVLSSYPNRDSMYLLLRRRPVPFPLSEQQFHWVSETNR